MYAIKVKFLIHGVNQWHLVCGVFVSPMIWLVSWPRTPTVFAKFLDLNIDLGANFLCDSRINMVEPERVATEIHNERAELGISAATKGLS